MEKLSSKVTSEGDLIVHNSASRSQQQNKKNALAILVQEIRSALHVPKKRIPTKISKALKEARLQTKARRSTIKKMRSKHTFIILFFFLWVGNITIAMDEKKTTATCIAELSQELRIETLNVWVDQSTTMYQPTWEQKSQQQFIRYMLTLSELNRYYHRYISSFAYIRKLFKALPVEVKYPLACRLVLKTLKHDQYDDWQNCLNKVLSTNNDAVNHRPYPLAICPKAISGIEYYFFLSFILATKIYQLSSPEVKLYLQAGADPNFYMDRGHIMYNVPPAHINIISNNSNHSKEKIALLLSYGANVNMELSLCVLLAHHGCPNGCPLDNLTPLTVALYYDNEDAVQEILKHKPTKIYLKQTFLSKNPTVKNYVLNAGFPFTKKDLNEGLEAALATQNQDDVATLLHMGADPNPQICKTVDRTIDGCLHPDAYKPYKDTVLYPEQCGYTDYPDVPMLSNIPILTTELVAMLCKKDAYDATVVEKLKALRDTAGAMIDLLENNKPNKQ